MHELQNIPARAPFGIRNIAPSESLTIAPVDTLVKIRLKCSRRSTNIGLYVPGLPAVGKLAVDSRGTWLSQSPREWLLLAPKKSADLLYRELANEVAPLSAAVVDVTDAIEIVGLSGPQAPAMLSKGSGIDVDQIASGFSTRIRLANIGLALAVLPDAHTLYLLVDRQHSAYLWTWLELTAAM